MQWDALGGREFPITNDFYTWYFIVDSSSKLKD